MGEPATTRPLAVTRGLALTGRVITAAAAIMVTVFASFMLGEDRIIKLFGLGLASAVLIDAVIIRSVLVPAIMQLFGKRAWWLPAWLDRILPRLHVEPAEGDPAPTGEHPVVAQRLSLFRLNAPEVVGPSEGVPAAKRQCFSTTRSRRCGLAQRPTASGDGLGDLVGL